MNRKAAVIFLAVFFGVYALVNYYIYSAGYGCMPDRNSKLLYNIVFAIFFFSFIFGKILERTHLFRLSRPVSWISSFWMGGMLYLFLFILILDVIKFADHFIGFLPDSYYCLCSGTKQFLFFITVSFVMILLLAGFINARIPVIRNISLRVPKKAGGMGKLRIAAVSDLHIGILFGKKRVASLAKRLNALNPDIILFVGDLIDEVPKPVIEMDMGAALRKLKAPLGKFAVTGNHEFIGGVNKSSAYIETLGIKLLRDEVITINDSFILAGRDDRDGARFTGMKRKELSELLIEANKKLPLILLDHQPFRLQDSEKHGVDLHLSGHTHHGQLWPLKYITKAIFELSWGYKKKGNTHFYVSSGYGTWMPQVRIGNRPEILKIEISFEE